MHKIERLIFPEPIAQVLTHTLEIFKDEQLFEEGGENHIPKGYSELANVYAWNILGTILLNRFFDGEPIQFKDEEQVMSAINSVIANVTIDSLKDYGILDSIEDENGEDIIFLTEKGKNIKLNNK